MPDYTATNWVNGVTATNQTNMNKIETQLAAVQYGMNIFAEGSIYQLINAVVHNAGTTYGYTCTGGSTGVPSGAKAVLLTVTATSTNTTNFIQFGPDGAGLVPYPTMGKFTITGVDGRLYSSFILPIASNGQIDVLVSGTGSCTITAHIIGYIY
jgi:hypothetical protein